MLALVLALLYLEDVLVEVVLHLFVGVVDQQLLERVEVVEVLEAVDVQQADEPPSATVGRN